MVLANKYDLLDNNNQSACVGLENTLEAKYPQVIYHEVSVLFNIELQ